MCNREIWSRRIDWFFPRSSTTIRGRSPGGGGRTSPPPPLHGRRWQNTEYGRGLTLDSRGAGLMQPPMGLMQPPWVFLSWALNRFEYRAEIFHSLWSVFCATFSEKNWSGQVRSRSYDVIRGTTFDRISAKSWVMATWCGVIDLNGDSWCDWRQYMTSCDPWPCITWVPRSSKVTSGHWPRLTSPWPIANRHMFSGVSWGAKSEFVVHCSQKRAQTTSSSSPRSIIFIRPIWILTVTAMTASEGDVLLRSTAYATCCNRIQ